jgi:protein-tyrosine-phosphatase
MAEVLFKSILEKRGALGQWRVESAGVWAYGGAPATENAREVMSERNLDLSSHRSQAATKSLLSRTDLIIVMTLEHKLNLLDLDPSIVNRVFLLREIAGGRGDFADPVGGSLATYRETAEELETLLRRGYQTIQKLASS